MFGNVEQNLLDRSQKSLLFLKSNFFFRLTIHSIQKFKDVPFPNYGACQKWEYFIFGYFSTKPGTSVDGHEKIKSSIGISIVKLLHHKQNSRWLPVGHFCDQSSTRTEKTIQDFMMISFWIGMG
jgi:hypothetical protein